MLYFLTIVYTFIFSSLGYEANPDGIDDCQKLFEASDDADADCLKGEVDEGDLNRHRTRPHGAEGQGLKKGYFSEIEYSSDGEGDDVQGKRYTDIATCQDDMSTGGDIDLGNISDGDVDDDDDADGTDESGRLSRSAESVCDLSCHLVKVSV